MLTNFFINIGLTRDSAIWMWGKWIGFCALVLSGLIDLNQYLPDHIAYWIRAIALISLMLSGHYDRSPLPGQVKK